MGRQRQVIACSTFKHTSLAFEHTPHMHGRIHATQHASMTIVDHQRACGLCMLIAATSIRFDSIRLSRWCSGDPILDTRLKRRDATRHRREADDRIGAHALRGSTLLHPLFVFVLLPFRVIRSFVPLYVALPSAECSWLLTDDAAIETNNQAEFSR